MDQQLAPVSARNKKGGSFVWKITLRQTLRSFGQMFWLNVLIFALFWGIVLYGVESVAHTLLPGEAAVGAGRYSVAASVSDSFFTVNTSPGKLTSGLPGFFTRRLNFLPGVRGFQSGGGDVSWFHYPGSVRYVITTPVSEDALCAVTFTPGLIWNGFAWGMTGLLFFEGISLIIGIFKISRSVRGTLQPISQLTLAAQQSMSAQSAPRKPADSDLRLDSTIDTLNAITESRLDARINVDNEREELRGLAQAINGMLNRVDSAYRSQLRFVSDASHELRTPISVIQGYASLLDRWGKEDQKTLDESVAAILSEAAGMKELVEQLLFLARGDNNSITLKMEYTDLAALMQEVARESEMIDTRHKIICPQRPPLFVNGDAQLLKQALRIFMDNALKYTPENGSVTLDSKEMEGYAFISVTDSGIGIGADDLPKLFDRFYRTDASRARQTGGSGLGLSIAKWIVDSHSGEIGILSREGIGTRITIRLALSPKAAEAQ